ncbi:MAG: cytidine deaminase [Gemmatimonadales bacterium]|jgi:cytidine deaminase
MGDALTERAQAAQQRAYARYSDFPVGAAVEADDGRVFDGVNVENAASPVAICAERVAVGTAVTAGVRHLVRVVVATNAHPPSAPCGACRQVLAEFANDDLIIDAVGPQGHRRWTLGELLPHRFGPKDLEST